ncbi:hypothetical protein [Mycolicibacterium sp.]|uniref:hypothetical protein n=1 Tax=Mycolicibacterium sp. TaxID=2320850 RepID=UPI00260017FD|nr:hypothetical protein [Mycolicibacterium sp.]MCB9408087.1 hypothetical protein [Mycolicibacterium sp.]MCB9424198.1 hypothetical protein [Actinomycetota bacterium]
MTTAERVRQIGYGLGGLTIPDTDNPAAELPSEVTIPVSAVDDFERDLQNVADDLDDWSIKLHDQFRELCMTVMKFAGFLDYEVTVRKRTAE